MRVVAPRSLNARPTARARTPRACDGGYRSLEEVEAWKKRDPIATFAARLVKEGAARQTEIDGIESAVDAEVAAAVQFAHDSPWPDPATDADHIFSHGSQNHA